MALESKKRDKGRFPWWPLVLLALSVYLFWVLPYQRKDNGIDVRFEPKKQER